jgi:hypothetical protein
MIALGVALTAPGSAPLTAQGQSISFFVSSTGSGMGGNLGGLAGADKYCQTLAAKAGAGNRTWRAYLSTSMPDVNARDRMGFGPWYNAEDALAVEAMRNGFGADHADRFAAVGLLEHLRGNVPTAQRAS